MLIIEGAWPATDGSSPPRFLSGESGNEDGLMSSTKWCNRCLQRSALPLAFVSWRRDAVCIVCLGSKPKQAISVYELKITMESCAVDFGSTTIEYGVANVVLGCLLKWSRGCDGSKIAIEQSQDTSSFVWYWYFCWPRCFRTTFWAFRRSDGLSLSPVITVMSCRSPGGCFKELLIGVPVANWK